MGNSVRPKYVRLYAQIQDIHPSIEQDDRVRKGPVKLTRSGRSDGIARCKCLDLSLGLRNRIAGEQCRSLSSGYVRGISGS